MKLRLGTGLLCLLLILLGLSTMAIAYEESSVIAEDSLVDPKIPESWYTAPKLASEMGITEFNQSPMLDERVANGELPPVEERLPEDPPVVEPYDNNIGEYGGTANLFGTEHNENVWNHHREAKAVRFTLDFTKDYAIPWMIKDWEYSNNDKDLTLYLREGLKWSDGEPLTASDYLFWWEKELKNKELTPQNYELVPLLDVTSDDPYTVTLHYEDNYPGMGTWGNRFTRGMTGSSTLTPEHFMKQFHKEIVDEEQVKEKMKVTGHGDWREFWLYKNSESIFHPEKEDQRPVLRPYVAVKRTPEVIIYERNPYYPFVDSEGNQLPYIDRIRVNVVSSEEMLLAKVVTGEADWEHEGLQIKDLPVIMKNKDKEGYSVRYLMQPQAADTNMIINLTNPDPQMRVISQDVRFRRALSLAINREEINDKYYLGTGVPRQQTVPENSEFFKEEYADAYAEYNPEKAKELLDEMGMVDNNGDGYREMPEGTMETYKGEKVELDGGKYEPVLSIIPDFPMPVFEMVQKHLSDVGINLRVNQIGNELFFNRVAAGKYDMMTFHKGGSLDSPYTPLGGNLTPFTLWGRWYYSDGESGEEPPENIISDLIDWAETNRQTTDEKEKEKAVRNILEAQAENVFTVGIVGMTSRICTFNNSIKNVWRNELSTPNEHNGKIALFRPIQFYIEE